MMQKSGMLQKLDEARTDGMHIGEQIMKQYMTDTLQIALHRTERFGFIRTMRLTKVWLEVQREYRPALNPVKNQEADVAQAHMDAELQDIIKGHMKLIPFQERFWMLKKVKYGKKGGNA